MRCSRWFLRRGNALTSAQVQRGREIETKPTSGEEEGGGQEIEAYGILILITSLLLFVYLSVCSDGIEVVDETGY